jgi:hypothetical protein
VNLEKFIADYEPLSEGDGEPSSSVLNVPAHVAASTSTDAPSLSESDPVSAWADTLITRMDTMIERWKA